MSLGNMMLNQKKKSDTKSRMLYDFIYVKGPEYVNLLDELLAGPGGSGRWEAAA